MNWDSKSRTYTLMSGRRFGANRGIIGLLPESDNGFCGQALEGYDGTIYVRSEEEESWTTAEREELADAMIHRWQRWKECRP